MSEHIHAWYITNFPRGAACKDCPELLDIREIERRLNANTALEAKLSKMEEDRGTLLMAAKIALKLIDAIEAADGTTAIFYRGTNVQAELKKALAGGEEA